MQRFLVGVAVVALALGACDFDSELAPRTFLPVVIDGSAVVTVQNDLGYSVEPERCRVALETIEFTTEGEQHASLPARIWRQLEPLAIRTAHAHPGHEAGGEVVGELPGRFVFEWRQDGVELGEAELLQTRYTGANFTFTRAEAGDRLEPDDPMIGHTFDIAGVARRDGQSWTFQLVLDQDEDRRVVGLPLDLDVDDGTQDVLALSLALQDPVEGDTVWDGLDFAALDEDGDGHVVIDAGTEAYNRVRRNLQAHDHYGVTLR